MITRSLRLSAAAAAFVTAAALLVPAAARAQQFNTDNYVTMPHGTVTTLVTAGTEFSAIIASASLARNWEFFVGAFLTWDDPENNTSGKFSTSVYAKYMFYENSEKNGGFGLAGGVGSYPGFLEKDHIADPATNYWILPEFSIPLFGGALSWDVNVGGTLNFEYGEHEHTKTGVLYSTRLALYGIVPSSAIVGEVFGTGGGAYAPPQYRIGVRWEPSPSFVGAATWSQAFNGEPSGGFEVGFMAFSPRWACFGGCDPGEYGD